MQSHKNIRRENKESGFTIIEVAVASVITISGLVFLASLFVVAISQNRSTKQSTATTALAQQKMEELNALEKNDSRLALGGELTEAAKQDFYWDEIYVDSVGGVTTTIPAGAIAHYRRYWKIENDPTMSRITMISVRVVALQAAKGNTAEETTLMTVRSW
jgi:Tfp pilus assembly protein PilV